MARALTLVDDSVRNICFLFLLAAPFVGAPAQANVVISTATTKNMDCASGVCTATAPNAVLNVTDLQTLLAVSNTKVATGTVTQDIVVSGAFSWAGTKSLTLDARRSIRINKAIAVTGTGAVIVATNKTNGTFTFGPHGSISFPHFSRPSASFVRINGLTYTLEPGLSALASDIAANPSGAYALAMNDNENAKVYSQSPIGSELTGNVNGLGNIISNYKVQYAQSGTTGAFLTLGGFIQKVASGASVANLRFVKLVVISAGSFDWVGGVVGENNGLVSGTAFKGTIRAGADSFAGGIAAQSRYASATIGNCSARVNLIDRKPSSTLGGLAAENDGTISQSFATGTMTGGAYDANGGVAGYNLGAIADSYSLMSIGSGTSSANGGIVGVDFGSGTISTSYAAGAVAGPGSHNGGAVGSNLGGPAFTDVYWDSSVSGTTSGVGSGVSTGIVGETTAQIQAGLLPGFSPAIWAENAKRNDGLPYLKSNLP